MYMNLSSSQLTRYIKKLVEEKGIMLKNKPTIRQAFTLVELMITILISSIVILVLGILLADGQKAWNKMYTRTNADVVTDGYVSRKAFDAVVRKASNKKLLLDENSSWLEVQYYVDSFSNTLDRYARFYTSDSELLVEHGKLNPKTTLFTHTICSNVSDCVFKSLGCSVQMILTLDDRKQKNTVITSAVMHNF